jgi:hypothetical protein
MSIIGAQGTVILGLVPVLRVFNARPAIAERVSDGRGAGGEGHAVRR